MKYTRILVVIAALFCFVLPTFAQDFGLGEDDGALLVSAVDSSAAAGSFSYEFTAAVVTAGMGEGGDVAIDIAGSGVVSADGFTMIVTGEITANGDSIPADLEIRVIEEAIYINIGGQWLSITGEDVTSLGDMAGGMGAAGGLPFDPNALMNGDVGEFGDAMAALNDLDATDFVAQARLEDEDGQARFQTSFDVAALLSNEDFGTFFSSILEQAAAQSGQDMDDMSPAQMGMMVQMMGVMLEDATFTFDQLVDLESNTVSGASLVMDVPLDAMTGEEGAGVLLNFDIELSGYGDSYTIEVPEDAQPLMEMFGAMMGNT